MGRLNSSTHYRHQFKPSRRDIVSQAEARVALTMFACAFSDACKIDAAPFLIKKKSQAHRDRGMTIPLCDAIDYNDGIKAA